MKMKISARLVPSYLLFSVVHGFLPNQHKSTLTIPSMRVAKNVGRWQPGREHHPTGAGRPVASSHSRLHLTQQGEGATNDIQPFIRPAPHNSPLFRATAILYALLFAVYQGSNSSAAVANGTLQKIGKYFILPPSAAATVHLLSFSTWFGTVVYTTFVAGITMFKNLPRRVFGTLQSKLFPLYFQLGTIMLGFQILTLTAMPDILSKTSELSLAIALISTLFNLLYLEPKSTSIMFDRYELEDGGKRESDEYSQKAKQFGMFHGMSSLANLIALCAGIVHGVRLASGLVV